MDAPRRIGEHLEHVVFGPRLIHAGAEGLALLPGLLPLGLGFAEVVARWRCGGRGYRRHWCDPKKASLAQKRLGPQRMPAAAPIVKRCEMTSGAASDAKLTRPRKDGVLDVDVGARIDLGVDPVAALG